MLLQHFEQLAKLVRFMMIARPHGEEASRQPIVVYQVLTESANCRG